jgi:hypothetical protein
MTREEVVNSMSLQDAIQVLKDTNCYGTMDIAKTVILKALEQEPCDDAISRQAVLEVIEKCHCEEWVKADIGAPIEALQSVTPAEKVGQWIYEKRKRLINETDEGAEYITDYWCKCSRCGGDFGYRKMKDAFCKYCGAKMGGEK